MSFPRLRNLNKGFDCVLVPFPEPIPDAAPFLMGSIKSLGLEQADDLNQIRFPGTIGPIRTFNGLMGSPPDLGPKESKLLTLTVLFTNLLSIFHRAYL